MKKIVFYNIFIKKIKTCVIEIYIYIFIVLFNNNIIFKVCHVNTALSVN